MGKISITRLTNSTNIYLDYHYGVNIIVSDNSICFDCKGKAKDVILSNISRGVFDNIDSSTIGYYQGKMKEKGVSKKEIDFVTGILNHYISEK